ncbi:MAG: hypothetical protein H0U87_01100 [Acidobacteria bacterium]|nr:hypothetical protein [Acidobacteriota bacterium]
MTAKAKIKVIKKHCIKNSQETTGLIDLKKPTQAAAAREIVSTVTNWVGDFQQRRREETRQALELLFQNNQQPSGV